MKKIFSMAALFAAGLLGFTSCSNEDIAQGGEAAQMVADGIYFKVADGNSNSKVLSRAAGVTTTSLSSIYVQATTSDNATYFGATPELFTYDGVSVFASATNHYWPNTGTLNFYASNQQETLSAGTQANPSPIVDDYECDGIKDWVTATVKAGEKTIPYPLTFQHVLSQIKISAEAKDKTQNLTYKVVGVKLSAPDTGDYQFANASSGIGTWTVDNSSSADYTYAQNMNGTFNPTAANVADQTWTSTDYFNILPVTSGTLTFDVQYQVIQNGQVIGDFTGANSKQVTVDAPNLLSGKIYTYNFVLAINTSDVITFTVNTTAWGSGSTTDVQVPEIVGSAFFKEVKEVTTSETIYDMCQCITNINPSLKEGDVVDFTFKVKENHNDYKSYTLSASLKADGFWSYIDTKSNTGVKFDTSNNEILVKRTNEDFESLIPLSLSINGTKIILVSEE